MVLRLSAALLVTLTGCGGDLLPDRDGVTAADDSSHTPESSPASSPGAQVPMEGPGARERGTDGDATKRRPNGDGPAPQSPVVPDLQVPELVLPTSRGPVEGGDVSWPQCPKGMGIPEKRTLGLPMPLASAEFVVLGLTNGPAFTPNPCLADQVGWVAERRLLAAAYAVHSFPDDATLRRLRGSGPYDGGTRLGGLRNVGYQQALFNLATMAEAGLRSPIVWLDVEPVPRFEWSPDTRANAAVVEGAARGYTDNGFQIGFYSTAYLWDVVVGDLRFGAPEWRAAGQTSRAEARRRCGPAASIQGGQAVLAQWVEDRRDRNITCPGISRDLFRWFFQY